MDILEELGLAKNNAGACISPAGWSKTKDQGEILSLNPATEKVIANIYNASLHDAETIIETAQKQFFVWRNIPAPQRGQLIRMIGDELRQKKILLGKLISLEMGKSLQEGLGEVQEMIDMADFAVGQSRMLYGKTMHSERFAHRLYEQWHPLGVTAIITAFNFPVAVWAWNAFLAVVCGNTVIWKPSPKTPLCALAVQHICNKISQQLGYNGIFSLLISNDTHLTEQLAKDPRIALFSFTGSSQVGQQLQAHVAQRFGRSLLELSGNNAIIVEDDADLALAIPSIVFGAIGTAGQRCTTTRRLFLHDKIYARVISSLLKAYSKIKIGDPLDEKNHMGPLVDQQAVAHYLHAIEEIKQQGGELLFGGHQIKQAGYFVEPTLATAENHWQIVQTETFAPILYVMRYRQLTEAIAMQNTSHYGLSSALFTNDLRKAELFLSARGSDCGITNINIGTSGAEIGGAFGGEKATGGGREAGSDAWQAYMRRQTNVIHFGEQLQLAQGIQFEINDSN